MKKDGSRKKRGSSTEKGKNIKVRITGIIHLQLGLKKSSIALIQGALEIILFGIRLSRSDKTEEKDTRGSIVEGERETENLNLVLKDQTPS